MATTDSEYHRQVRQGLQEAGRWLRENGYELKPFSDPELPELLYVAHILVGSKPRIVKFRESFLADHRNDMPTALEAAELLRRLPDASGPIVIPE